MRRLKVLGFVSMAWCVFGVAMAGSASAAETFLPLFSVPTGGSATSGETRIITEGANVACKSSTSTFGAGTRLGTFATHFNKCTSAGLPCNSLGDTTELVLFTGEWHLVALPSNRTHYLLLLLIGTNGGDNSGAEHVECEFFGLVLIWGDFLGLIEEIAGGKTFKLNITTEGGGNTIKQQQHEFANNSGTTVMPLGLRLIINETGTERPAGRTISSFLLFMEKTTKLEKE